MIVQVPRTQAAGTTSAEEMLRAVRQGRCGLGPLLGPFRDRLNALARNQVSPRLQVRHSPSDIVQETLLHACRDFPQFRGRSQGELWTWLRQILNHRILGAARHHLGTAGRDLRREAPAHRSAANHADRFADSQTSPSGQVVREERRRTVRVMVRGLPRDYRRVLILRIVAELPFDQIADRLQRSPDATRQLYQRARQRMLDRVRQQDAQ